MESAMKTIPFLFLVLSFVTLSPSPAPAIAGGRDCLAASTPSVDVLVDQSIEAAAALAARGSPVDAALAAVQSAVRAESLVYTGSEGECLILQRLEDEIAELRARAQRYLLHAFEVEALQREIVFARLERAMLAMRQRWARGEPADELVETAIRTLQADAWRWIEERGPTTVRERLQNAIFAAQQAAQDQIDVLHKQIAFFQALYEARFESAISVLQKHLASGRGSTRDFARVEALVDAYYLIHLQLLPYPCSG
jgi:hypothetical protein